MTNKVKKNTVNKNKIFFWIVIVLVIGVVGWMFANQKVEDVDSTSNFDIDLSAQPVLGSKDAKVQVIEFGDYKCPACKSFGESFVPLIQEDFINDGDVSFYFMNYDFIHSDSTRAAEFAEVIYQELGNEIFWNFHELLYANQPEDENVDYFTEDKLLELLKQVALIDDVSKVQSAFENGEGKKALRVDNEYVERLELQSTPAVFINGELFTDGTYEDFSKQVNEALESE